MNKEEKFKELERTDLWINNSDTKISYLFAVLGIVTTIIFTNNSIIEIIKNSIKNLFKLDRQDIENILSIIVIMTFINLLIFIVRSIYFLFKASTAKININDINKGSTLFFGSIASKTIEEFKEQINNQTEEELEEDIVEQIFINAKICNEKMKNYNKAIKNLKISMLIFIIFIISIIIM